MSHTDRVVRGRGVRRGVAMVLVIASVATITVVLSVFMSSRQDGPQVAANGASGIAARAAAESGLDLAHAIMAEPNIDWRTKHVAGVLVNNYNFGTGTITITVKDEFGNAPDADTEFVFVECTGTVSGFSQIAESEVYAPVDDNKVDIDLSEFAVFGQNAITIDDAVVGRWDASPTSFMKWPVRIGTNSTATDAVRVANLSNIIDGSAYVRGDAAGNAINDAFATRAVKRVDVTMSESLPVPASRTVDTSDILLDADTDPAMESDLTTTFVADKHYGSFKVDKGAKFVSSFPAPTRVAIDGDVSVTGASTWLVEGEVDLVISGNLVITGDSVLRPADAASHLKIYVGGTVLVQSSALGGTRAVRTGFANPIDIETPYRSPETLQLYKQPGSRSSSWRFMDNALVLGEIHGKNADVQVSNMSAVFGRVLGYTVNINSDSVVFYDPMLDTRRGYTNPRSALFEAAQDLDDAATAVISTVDDGDTVKGALDFIESGIVRLGDKPPRPVFSKVTRVGVDVRSDVK